MAMREYPIIGYGVGFNWNDKEAILNLMDLVDVEGEMGLKFSSNEEKLEFFHEENFEVMEVITDVINNEIFKRYPEEEYGLDFEAAHEEYVLLLFHNVRYGFKPSLDISDVNEIIESLSREIFDFKEGSESDLDVAISERFGVYGDIFLTYIA